MPYRPAEPIPGRRYGITTIPDWLHDYNWHRLHTAIGGPPAKRLPVNNVCVKDN